MFIYAKGLLLFSFLSILATKAYFASKKVKVGEIDRPQIIDTVSKLRA